MAMTRVRKNHQQLWDRAFSASYLLEACGSTGPFFLIQDIGDTQQVLGRPEVDVDFFCGPGIGMPKNGAYELDGDAFSVQGRGEIMTEGMRAEPRYPGVPGKFITETPQTVWRLIALY